MAFIKLTDLDLAGKRVLIRADLNVPVKDGKVTSDARITASMPTVEHCAKAGAKEPIQKTNESNRHFTSRFFII